MCYACMAMGIQEEQTSCKTISTIESANCMNSYHIRISHSKLSEKIIQHNKSKSHHKPQYEQMRMQWQASLMTLTVQQIIQK